MKMNRKQRRAQGKGSRFAVPAVKDLSETFREQLDQLALLGGFANHVSMELTGLPTTPNGALASAVFAKCCAHARSITAVTHSSMFDHHTIMVLARMIMEASTMIAYLLDPVGPEEQAFRNVLLRLHDTVSRIKLLRAFEQTGDDLRAGRDALRSEIEAHPSFRRLPEDRRKRLDGGEEMFAIGMRAVAIRIMGWNETKFSGIYAYFPAHTHSAPMSFIRMADHQIDYFYPSKAQIDILALSMEVAMACLRRSMLRMIDQHPVRIEAYHPELLAEARDQDESSVFFSSTTTRTG